MTVDTPYAPLRRVPPEEHEAVVDVLTEAFVDDPVVRWVFDDADGPLQPHFYRSLLTHPTAEAYLVGGRAGAAVWQTYAEGGSPHEEEVNQPGANLFGESGTRLRALGRVLARRHPGGEPHLYLPCMGVAAGRRGTGLGSTLLRHRLIRADADGLGAYLEASSPLSRALYLRHGFTDLGEPVRVAGSPPLYPMWRHPRR